MCSAGQRVGPRAAISRKTSANTRTHASIRDLWGMQVRKIFAVPGLGESKVSLTTQSNANADR